MSKQISNKKTKNDKSNNEKLKEKYEKEMAEKDMEMEALRKEMEEKIREDERKYADDATTARCVQATDMEGMQIVGERMGNISEVSSHSLSSRLEQLPLNDAQKINCNIYVTTILYSEIKFIDDDMFRGSPKLLEETMKRMGVESEKEKLQLCDATKREIKYSLTHRRSYCKSRLATKYQGKREEGCCATNI